MFTNKQTKKKILDVARDWHDEMNIDRSVKWSIRKIRFCVKPTTDFHMNYHQCWKHTWNFPLPSLSLNHATLYSHLHIFFASQFCSFAVTWMISIKCEYARLWNKCERKKMQKMIIIFPFEWRIFFINLFLFFALSDNVSKKGENASAPFKYWTSNWRLQN